MDKRDVVKSRTPTDTERKYRLDSVPDKVDKEEGKGLSTNDFSNGYKRQVEANSTSRHTHYNMSILNAISQETINSIEEKQLYTLFTGESKNIQLSDNLTNYDLIGVSYGNGTISDMKFIMPANNIQFYISLNTNATNEEKSLCIVNENTLTSESINILKVIGFKFRKGVVQSGGN
ncbi:hypothetical protein [uncultured Thomasclavelia sp.]|uniref:hypothetical protein n=1 Tax=uncultured Thomasclavelia sp. TaxID=3025759 RepID=UPI0025924819|nr:hypothetical protein [uncultured Thomasclavelia sp.]